ncbi:MAG: hypothetical protein Q8O67_34115 [Deltaproteobacteria bacterium]|nr:hypothetical protein [Deltaproteobacteria bacterium]
MFSDPSYVDELPLLVERHGEEMSPSLKALVTTTRVWLNVLSGCGFIVAFALGTLVCVGVHRLFDGAAFILPLIQVPLSLGAFLGLRRVRGRVAQLVAARVKRRLNAVSGSTSAAAPLGLPLGLPRGR